MRQQRRHNRHIWVYDDSVNIGPLGAIAIDEDGESHVRDVNVWEEIQKVKMSVIISAKSHMITISRGTWDAINVWAENQFGGLELHDYLNRMFAKCATTEESRNTSDEP